MIRIVGLLLILACSLSKAYLQTGWNDDVEVVTAGTGLPGIKVADCSPTGAAPGSNFPQQDEYIKIISAGGITEYYKRVLPSEVPNP